MSLSKKNILQRLKAISNHDQELPYPSIDNDEGIFVKKEESLDILFAKEFQQNGGKFVFCESQQELVANLQLLVQQRKWKNVVCWNESLQEIFRHYDLEYDSSKDDLLNAAVGITTCEALIARTGSILLSSQTQAGRSLSIVPPVHIVIATPNQVVYNLKDMLSLQTARDGDLPSMLCFTSTNSQTADIEKTLINGAHGPKELFVFMLEQ